MGPQSILVSLLLVVPFIQGQDPERPALVDSEPTTTEEAPLARPVLVSDEPKPDEEEGNDIVSAPIYSDDECNAWISTLISNDANGSGGLSESEYHTFLTSIEDPPYIVEYFAGVPDFDSLPWVFRVVHKSLACHCQKLGMGEECCEGDDAEVLLLGLEDLINNAQEQRDAITEEYRDLFCQQIAYVLGKSIDSPEPTNNPTDSPSDRPSGSPTTLSPTPAPVITTVAPTYNATEVLPKAIAPEPEPEDEGLSTGAIVGIILGLLALLAIIAFVAYKKRKKPIEEPPEGDIEEPVAAAPEDDDESSAPSVWSDSDAGDDDEMVDTGEEVAATAGSSLAAMGAASTVASNLMSPTGSSKGF